MFDRANCFRSVCKCSVAILILSASLSAQSPPPRRIALVEAQNRAAGAAVADIARLGVDAARYHRQAVQADYFPKIDATFWNLHFNKFMGQRFELARRDIALPLVDKDQTVVVVTATQPVTPIFKIRQAVEIARADEAIARAKASYAAAQTASAIEQTYLTLLIAQRRQTAAAATVRMLESGIQVTSNVAFQPGNIADRHAAVLKAGKDLTIADGEVIELTQSLNKLIGFPAETELELTEPEPVVENIALHEVTQNALTNSPELVEAEQTVVKAKAATRLSKLDYVPDVAVIGGYTYQTAIPALPRDFSFIGAIATLNVFDFGKREKTSSERKTQLSMAEANVELIKAKVAANAQKAFLDLQRARKIRDLTRQVRAYQSVQVSIVDLKPDAQAAWAQSEAEMFQAELDYRLAYAALKRITEGR